MLRNDSKPALELCGERDLSSFSRFTRDNYNEFMMLFTKTVAERTNPGQRLDIEEKSYTFHAYGRTEGVAGIIISDGDYPQLVAHQLLSKVVDEFLAKHPRTTFADPAARPNSCPLPQLKEYLEKFQDPSQADSIMKIQQELDETKIVLHKTIEGWVCLVVAVVVVPILWTVPYSLLDAFPVLNAGCFPCYERWMLLLL